jgi:tRNA A-37 threonylcarbamoyl transferase component Bud32
LPGTCCFFNHPTLGATVESLSAATAPAHLHARLGVDASGATVTALGGGVSSIVLRVTTPAGAWVLKQPLGRFRVAASWEVDERRALTEARFARLLHETLGPVLPRVLDHDPATQTLILEAMPTTFVPWKTHLLAGQAEAPLAGRAGDLLARIHRIPAEPSLAEPELFQQQRLDPYFLTAAHANPAVAGRLLSLATRLGLDRTSLIHGDFSPKNLLTDGGRLVLVDHEVATVSDPRFDMAFLLSHLLLKAFHGVNADGIQELVDEFLYRYARAHGPARPDASCAAILSALLLARVDGKSPVEYLTGEQRNAVRAFALRWLQDDQAVIEDVAAAAFRTLKA